MSVFPQTPALRTGETLLLRETEVEDAPTIISYLNQVAGETDFLSFGEGELIRTIEEQANLTQQLNSSPNQLQIAAIIDQELIGLLHISASPKPRLRHIGTFAISIKQAHCGKGIGSIMIQQTIDWVKQNAWLRKLNLAVLTHNTNAVHLYEKLGFEKEAAIKRDFYLDGQFYDAYRMGMLID